MLASKAGAPTFLLWAGVEHLRHLLQLQRGALRPAQHHLRQHWEDEPLPVSPHLLRLALRQQQRFLLLYAFLIRPLHLHVPADSVPLLWPCEAGMLHLRGEKVEVGGGEKTLIMWEKSREEGSEAMRNHCMNLANTGHCMLRSFDLSLIVHRLSDLLTFPSSTKDRVHRERQARPRRLGGGFRCRLFPPLPHDAGKCLPEDSQRTEAQVTKKLIQNVELLLLSGWHRTHPKPDLFIFVMWMFDKRACIVSDVTAPPEAGFERWRHPGVSPRGQGRREKKAKPAACVQFTGCLCN